MKLCNGTFKYYFNCLRACGLALNAEYSHLVNCGHALATEMCASGLGVFSMVPHSSLISIQKCARFTPSKITCLIIYFAKPSKPRGRDIINLARAIFDPCGYCENNSIRDCWLYLNELCIDLTIRFLVHSNIDRLLGSVPEKFSHTFCVSI